MNITVVGAGATGGYFGARLADAGHQVTFLVRPNRAAQLQEKGLVIKSVMGDLTLLNPLVALQAEEIPACDLVLLALKNYQLSASLPMLKVLVERGAKVLPFLNGVEHFEILAEALGKEAVLGGVCRIISTLDAEGTIHHTSRIHQIQFGELTPSQEAFCQQLSQALSGGNMKASYSKNIWQEIWSKYAFINVFSGVTTAGDLTTDQIYAYEATKEVYRQALVEMAKLAATQEAALPEDYVEQNVESLGKYQNGSTSSMHQDKRKEFHLEVESLQGAAIRIAAKAGMALPTITTLYGLIKPFELGAPKE